MFFSLGNRSISNRAKSFKRSHNPTLKVRADTQHTDHQRANDYHCRLGRLTRVEEEIIAPCNSIRLGMLTVHKGQMRMQVLEEELEQLFRPAIRSNYDRDSKPRSTYSCTDMNDMMCGASS
jgi:hypothetical protein